MVLSIKGKYVDGIKLDIPHSQSRGVTEELVDGSVVRSNPADPRELREGGEKITGEEVYYNG